MNSWKRITILLQVIALVTTPLSVAIAAHSDLLEPESHSHLASSIAKDDHAKPHHGMAAAVAFDNGIVVAAADLGGDHKTNGKNGCCHLSGGLCASLAIVDALVGLVVTERHGSLIGGFSENFKGICRPNIFHPPRPVV